MKKRMILAIVAVAAVAAPAFAVAFHHRHEAETGNVVCFICGGTGRSYDPAKGKGQGMLRCSGCNGTGFRGSY